jgi:hypothetical protein
VTSHGKMFWPVCTFTHSRYSPVSTGSEQIYGGFDFGRGAYKGVFRFASQQEEHMGNQCKDDIEEFLLPKEIPSVENLTICYRWRER